MSDAIYFLSPNSARETYIVNLPSPRAKTFTILCPWHEEETPSCAVSPAKELFYCFGCGTHGKCYEETAYYLEQYRWVKDHAGEEEEKS